MSGGSYRPFDLGDWQAASSVITPVAGVVTAADGFADWGKGADFRQFQRERATPVAAVTAVTTPPHPWATGIADLQSLPCPAWLATEAWDGLVYQAVTIARDWAAQAHALGWTAIDLFGCNPQPWIARSDREGLVPLLAGWRGPAISVRAVTAQTIALEVDRGQLLHFRRHERAGSVPMWLACAQEGGP